MDRGVTRTDQEGNHSRQQCIAMVKKEGQNCGKYSWGKKGEKGDQMKASNMGAEDVAKKGTRRNEEQKKREISVRLSRDKLIRKQDMKKGGEIMDDKTSVEGKAGAGLRIKQN